MKYVRSVLFLGIMAAMPLFSYGQDDARNWRKLGGEVCMPLEELHLVHAKRLVSDDLNRTRARILVRQDEVIRNLQLQIEFRDEDIDDLKELTADAFAKRDYAIDLNSDLQKKMGKQTGWATVGKVGTVMVTMGLVVAVISIVTP